MKKIWSLILLVIFATGICAAEVPDLLGKWTGSFSSCNGGNVHSSWMNGSIFLTITDQKGRIFAGNLTIKVENETAIGEGFAGAIGLDNKTFYLAESDKGYALGTIISKEEIEYIYITDGRNASASIDKLYRRTNMINSTNPFAKAKGIALVTELPVYSNNMSHPTNELN
jgi:hypothetical protein